MVHVSWNSCNDPITCMGSHPVIIPGFFEDVQIFLRDRQEAHSYTFQMDWISVLHLIM